jgi:hypothetical protein
MNALYTFGPWHKAGIVMRLFGAPRWYRARFACRGPALANSAWKFDGYEYTEEP